MITTAGKTRVTGFHCRQLQKDCYHALKSFMELTGGHNRGSSADNDPVFGPCLAVTPGQGTIDTNGAAVEGAAINQGDYPSQL
jgi:hypothetical protein